MLGKQGKVNAVAGQASPLLIEKAQKGSITTSVTLEKEIPAPVSKGQRLGTFTVKSGDQILAQIPLVAETAVKKKTFADIFLELLKMAAMAK